MIQDAAATAESAALLIEHAKKAYGKSAVGRTEAVSDVSLCVSRGAIHGLLGPNGAGKTTTLKMLLGLVRPTSGRFEILGASAHAPGARGRLGFLPEQPYFPTQLTAGEAMRLYGRLAGISRIEVDKQTPELLESVGLEGRSGDLLSRFSRGMLQRLGLAQALLGQARSGGARRTRVGSRPGGPARHPQSDDWLEGQRDRDSPFIASALRGRSDLRRGDDPQSRSCCGQGAHRRPSQREWAGDRSSQWRRGSAAAGSVAVERVAAKRARYGHSASRSPTSAGLWMRLTIPAGSCRSCPSEIASKLTSRDDSKWARREGIADAATRDHRFGGRLGRDQTQSRLGRPAIRWSDGAGDPLLAKLRRRGLGRGLSRSLHRADVRRRPLLFLSRFLRPGCLSRSSAVPYSACSRETCAGGTTSWERGRACAPLSAWPCSCSPSPSWR